MAQATPSTDIRDKALFDVIVDRDGDTRCEEQQLQRGLFIRESVADFDTADVIARFRDRSG